MNQTCSFMPRSLTLRSLCCVTILCLLTFSSARLAYAVGGTFFDGLDSYDASRWLESDGWTNGNPFNVGWRADFLRHLSQAAS